ncbi:DUF305 domain-containing protein (plasmid) [Streptomyces mirabilis]|uniref:DUF305 domain-containing protein n=1 Tax=Streptomyces mirabilis TaxID=68239 RepID=UPI001BAF3EB0|nr:DUF305 domain-containing protein [Streptomyces mirabilis]QUW85704.1 DUF305 domain-containing protein [Streptomyces mirabilis]
MTTHRSTLRRAAAVTAAATVALVLAACGSSDTGTSGSGTTTPPASASASTGAHNAADVAFATQMIQHHRQAIAMADLAATRAANSDVKTLATKIKNAQDPEITTMSGWLKTWGEKVPDAMGGMDHGMDHGNASPMPGMMTTQQMDELKDASGKAFDTAFLTMMVGHHQGAIEMAKTEKSNGVYGPAKALADDVITAQSAEITQMNKMLGTS